MADTSISTAPTRHILEYEQNLNDITKAFEGTSTTINSELNIAGTSMPNATLLRTQPTTLPPRTQLLIKSLHSRISLKFTSATAEAKFYTQITR
jgi:hypothetical protein